MSKAALSKDSSVIAFTSRLYFGLTGHSSGSIFDAVHQMKTC